MTTVTAGIAQEILKQSLVIGILSIGAYFFYNDNRNMIDDFRKETREEIKELKEDIKDCNSRNETILRNQIDKNNAILDRIEDCINPRRR